MASLTIEQWPIGRLIPYENNPRKNDDAVPRMVTVIREFGFRVPVLAKSTGDLVDGHLRLKAAMVLGLDTVPVITVDDMSLEQVRAFRIMINRSATWADWDDEALLRELQALQLASYDLSLTGFDQRELDEMLMQLDDHSDDFEAYCIVPEIDVTREVQVPSATSLFLYIKDHPCISLDDTTFRRMLKYCRMFSEFERNGHPYRDQITLHMSMMLYYEIFHIYQHGKPLAMSAQTRQESMFREFLFLVSQHYVREREIGYYADQICVTPKYLSSVVRTVSGNSAAWWINHTVIMHAKNLLKTNHQLTIQQISDKLNFPNPSFFGQYFKRRVGMTPKEFRRKAY